MQTLPAPARKGYPLDLRNEEWALLEPLVPAVKSGGRPARHTRREIVNAILYVVQGGNQWRALPHDLPPWQTAYTYFRLWRNAGTWETIHSAVREQGARIDRSQHQRGDSGQPIGEVQPKGGLRGYDADKKVMDESNAISWWIPRASRWSSSSQRLMSKTAQAHGWWRTRCRCMGRSCRASPRSGRMVATVGRCATNCASRWAGTWRWSSDEDTQPKDTFAVQPQRWIVERTFAWWGGLRRLSRDYEYQVESAKR